MSIWYFKNHYGIKPLSIFLSLILLYSSFLKSSVAVGPDDFLPKVELTSKKKTKGPDDPSNADKNIFWVDKEDETNQSDQYWKKTQRFVFKENRHEVKIFVPVHKDQSSRDVHIQITEKYY